MLQSEITVLHALSAANGSPVKAETLKEKSGFSDTELQMVMDSLKSKGWANPLGGGELTGKPLRFYLANITPSGTAALLPHMKFANQPVSKLEKWQIEHELIERVSDDAEAYQASGDTPLIAAGKAFRDLLLSHDAKPDVKMPEWKKQMIEQAAAEKNNG